MAAVWLDVARCVGCGACIEVCPTSALALVEGKARLDDTLCRGCEACVRACPAGALQPVLEVKAVPLVERVPESASWSGATSPRPSLLAAAVATGAQLAVRAIPLVLQVVGQWLRRPRGAAISGGTRLTSTGRLSGLGQQLRRRRRGRW